MRSRITYARWAICFTAICLLVTAGNVIGQSLTAARTSATTTTAINVTSTIFDTDLGGVQLLTRSDDYNGVGQASYATIKNPKGAGNLVTSQIQTDGKWYLDLDAKAGRTVYVTPNSPVGSQSSSVPPAGYYVIVSAYSVCRDAAGNTIPYPNLTLGTHDECSFAINFNFNGTLYKLLMGPVQPDQGTTCPSGGCPAMGLAKVICNAVTSSKCVNWTMEPNANAVRYTVANLYSYTGGKSGPWVFIGQYYNTFRINASNP